MTEKDYSSIERALASRMKNFADRLGVAPCDPSKVEGGILVYSSADGPVYDLMELLEEIVKRLEQVA